MINRYFLFLLLFSPLAGLCQGQFFVSSDGDDNNPGTLMAPWKTIQYGADQIQPGDTLYILEGTYYEKLDLSLSGSAAHYTTFKAFDGGEVMISGENATDDLPLIFIGGSYIRLEGLHITNFKRNYAAGIAVEGVAHDIIIQNNKISQIGFSQDPNAPVNENTNAVPLGVLGNESPDSVYNIFLLNNEIFDNQTGYSESLALGGNVSGFLVEGNVIHDNTNIGIVATGNYGECPTPQYDHARRGVIRANLVHHCNAEYSAAAGIYVDGGWDIVVENNISHHNGYGGEIGCEEDGDTRRITFRSNLFYQNEIAGMHMGGYDPNTTGTVLQSSIHNNTFYYNDTNNDYNGSLILSQSEDCSIENNLFYISPQNVWLASDRTQKRLTFDFNLVYADAGKSSIITAGNIEVEGLDRFYSLSGYGKHDTWGNPLFLSPGIDFHISPGSPAINAGNPDFIPDAGEKDLDGQARIYDNIVDAGAYEHYPSTETYSAHSSSLQKIGVKLHLDGNHLTISGLPPGQTTYRIYTIDGREIHSVPIDSHQDASGEITVDLIDLPPNQYFLVVYGDHASFSTVFTKF